MKRERIGSRLGFIMLCAGSAIGCGNIWKFPWTVGQNGGGIFVFVYIICIILLGVPALTAELSIGRASQTSIVESFDQLEKPGERWKLHGYMSMMGSFVLLFFYTVVTGWILYYFCMYLTGNGANLDYDAMLANPFLNEIFMIIVVVISSFIVSFDIRNGIERVTKFMMIALLVLLFVLAFNSMTMEGASKGLSFYLKPDFSKLSLSMFVAALQQAFFSLGIGLGAMAVFGSFIDKNRSLLGESVIIVFLDTMVAIVAGCIIFPACFAYGVEVTSGPSLLFDTMTKVFNNIGGGRLWGTLFFLFMSFAAFSSVVTTIETCVDCVKEIFGLTRKKASVVCGVIVGLVSSTTALGYSVLPFHPFGQNSTWLNLWDFIVSMNLLPLCGIVFVVFCCFDRIGWGWDNFLAEANSGKGLKIQSWMKPFFKYILPICILLLYIIGLVTFEWN